MTHENHDDPDDGEHDDERDAIHVEFGLSMSDLLGGILGGSAGGDSGQCKGRPGAAGAPEPSARNAQQSSTDAGEAAEDYHVDTYREDEHVVVVADLPGVDFDDVSAGVLEETNDLVVLVEGDVVERVPLSGERVDVTDSTFNNGILEIRLRPVDESGA